MCYTDVLYGCAIRMYYTDVLYGVSYTRRSIRGLVYEISCTMVTDPEPAWLGWQRRLNQGKSISLGI